MQTEDIYKLFILFLFFISSSEASQYNGFKVYEVIPSNKRQSNILEKLYKSNNFDFWSRSRLLHHPTFVMVEPNLIKNFLHTMKSNMFQYSEMIDDVAKCCSCSSKSRVCKHISPIFSLQKYNTYEGINNYINELVKYHSTKVRKIFVAKTIEGRNVVAIKISTNTSSLNQSNKPAILIDAGIHAREWISTASALYFIYQLTENKSNQKMLIDVDWYIIPLLNPDGYVYSQKSDRFWRKNRSRGKYCNGVDDNRNFNFHWMEGGSSPNECSEIYAGPEPFSEPETKGFRNFVEKRKNHIKLYLTLHSYGSFILYPWSYRDATPCEDYLKLMEVGEMAAKAIEYVNGRKYIVGSSGDILYEASGNSEDWVKGVAGVQMCFAMELPGGGVEGFDIAAEQIVEVASETFEGVKVFWEYVNEKFCF